MSIRVGIIDADLISRNRHRFPNLACMKISGYHKNKGDKVTLITEYLNGSGMSMYSFYYNMYDKIYVSKVFVDTTVPYELLNLSITEYGGTGFFYANAPSLPPEIEHNKPDYHLYDDWIAKKRAEGKVSDREFIYYEEYSIGFMTRYCVRHCPFCVNQHKNKVEFASHVKEFLEKTQVRNKICLLDDNVLSYDNWQEIFEELNATGVSFEFKQGLDIRALTKEKAEVINNIYFAFDNIEDKDIIIEKLKLWRSIYNKNTHMYVLYGFDKNNKYNKKFWSKDIEGTLERIKICMEFGVFPYIMRFRKYNSAPSPYRGMYINLAAWCNQRNLFSRMSLNRWADELQKSNEKQLNKKRLYSTKRYLMEYAGKYPEIAYEYFDLKFDKDTKYKYVKDTKDNKPTILQKKDILIIPDIIEPNIMKSHEYKQIVKDKQIISLNDIKKTLNMDIERIFYNGVDLSFSNNSMKYLHENFIGINNILLKITNNEFLFSRKLVILYSEYLLSYNGNLFISINGKESYMDIKQFIKTKTDFYIYQEICFKNTNGNISYLIKCGKNKLNYTMLMNRKNIVTKEDIFNAIFQTINSKDFIISFFELESLLKTLNKKYNTKCINIKNGASHIRNGAINYLKQILGVQVNNDDYIVNNN